MEALATLYTHVLLSHEILTEESNILTETSSEKIFVYMPWVDKKEHSS